MRIRSSAWLSPVVAVACKEVLSEIRTRYAISILVMFVIITLAAISMSIGGTALEYPLAAALLWVVIFFSAMAGLSRVFVSEQESGTLFTLRIYAGAQAVLFGKLLFNILLLTGLVLLVIPLFILFFNVDIELWSMFLLTLGLGIVGISSVSTLTAAMAAEAQGKGSLFTVITFPVLLPQFLGVIKATASIFAGDLPGFMELIFLVGYDIVMLIASSIFFDYLWRDS